MNRLAVVVLVSLFVLSIPGAMGGETSQISIGYSGEWSGTIGTDGNSRTVEGSGNETFDMDGQNVAATIRKLDNGSDPLTVRILQDGSIVEEETTTAGNGVVRVSHIFKDSDPGDGDDGGGVYCLLIILGIIVVLIFVIKRYKQVEFRLPWVIRSTEADRARDPQENPVGHPRQPPPTKPPAPDRPQ